MTVGAVRAPAAVEPAAPVVPGTVGILGGTFDPVHHGHLVIAEEAREALGLERVVLVPAAQPPHKPGRPVTAAAHRLAMLELATGGNPAFSISRVELERGGPSYTVETLGVLRSGGVADPWFILSAEALAEFPDWREPARVLDLCRLAVVPRGGYEPGKYVATFVGMVPASNPKLVVLVTVDEPQLAIFGGIVAAPAFAKIAAFDLQYLEVPPDEPLR